MPQLAHDSRHESLGLRVSTAMHNVSPVGSVESARSPIFGRDRELDVFRASFARAVAGQLQVVLVSGEPGIGKTRCAEGFAAVAEDHGSVVLWGRCHEEAGAPPLWPWIQILRQYVEASSLDELLLNAGSAGADLRTLLPELGTAHPEPELSPADGANARFRIFDAMAQFLHRASLQVPIVIVIDNLHWADPLSLSLLEFLAESPLRQRIVLLCTYRDIEAETRTIVTCALGALARSANHSRLQLAGLPRAAIADVAAWIRGSHLSSETIERIYARSDGNPLFAIELIRALMDESASEGSTQSCLPIPAGIRETIAQRVARLPADCMRLLEVASVCGRDFDATELAAVSGQSAEEIFQLMQPATAAGIVRSDDSTVGRFQFAHALIRDTVYTTIPKLNRLRIHRDVANALVALHEPAGALPLARIAHHFYAALPVGDIGPAVEYAFRAAAAATRIYAYEAAVEHYDRAIELLSPATAGADEKLARAYLLKGYALKQLGLIAHSIEVLLAGTQRVRALGSAELLIDVLVFLGSSSSHVPQPHVVPLIAHALSLLPVGDSPARAKATALLAFARRTVGGSCELDAGIDEALAIARRCCVAADACACFQLCMIALRGRPQTLQRRLATSREHVEVARSSASDDLLAEAYHWQALNLLEAGAIDELEHVLSRYASQSPARFGLHQYQLASYCVTVAMLRGEFAGIEERIERLREIGTRTRREDADGVYGAQMFAIHRDLGRLEEQRDEVQRILRTVTLRTWDPGLALMCAEVGLMDEAREGFERLAHGGFAGLARDEMYPTCLAYCAETCVALQDRERATTLHSLLEAFAHQTLNHPTAVSFGAAEYFLGSLAFTAGDLERAAGELEDAVAENRAMRAWPWLARSLVRLSMVSAESRVPGSVAAAQQQLREAEQLAQRLGMRRLMSDIDRLSRGGEDSGRFPDQLTAREVEVLRLLALGRTNKDVARVLAISLNTVATHIRSILAKTQCANRTEAASYAIRHGLYEAQPR